MLFSDIFRNQDQVIRIHIVLWPSRVFQCSLGEKGGGWYPYIQHLMSFIRLCFNINHTDYSFRPLVGIREDMVQFLRLKQHFEWTKWPFPYYFHGVNSFKYLLFYTLYCIFYTYSLQYKCILLYMYSWKSKSRYYIQTVYIMIIFYSAYIIYIPYKVTMHIQSIIRWKFTAFTLSTSYIKSTIYI